MHKKWSEFHRAAQLLCSSSCPRDKDHMGLTLFCILNLQTHVILEQGESRRGWHPNSRQDGAHWACSPGCLCLMADLGCSILENSQGLLLLISKGSPQSQTYRRAPLWTILYLKLLIWKLSERDKKWQSGRVAPNIRGAPSNTYSQLQNASLDPVRHLEQRQRRAHQLQRTDPADLCSLPAPAPPGLSQTPESFGNYCLLCIYLASTAKGYPSL